MIIMIITFVYIMQCNIYNMYLTSSLMGRPIWMKSCTKIVTHEVIVNMYKLYKRFVINPSWFWYSATPLWMQFFVCVILHVRCLYSTWRSPKVPQVLYIYIKAEFGQKVGVCTFSFCSTESSVFYSNFLFSPYFCKDNLYQSVGKILVKHVSTSVSFYSSASMHTPVLGYK